MNNRIIIISSKYGNCIPIHAATFAKSIEIVPFCSAFLWIYIENVQSWSKYTEITINPLKSRDYSQESRTPSLPL